MATHDYSIANADGASVRLDLNNALAAIVSNNSSGSEPTDTFAYMWWADTTNGFLKLRNAADSDWVIIASLADGISAGPLISITVEGSDGTSDWTQASGSDPWIATMTATGVLSTDTPMADIDLSSVSYADVSDVQDDWALVYRVEASDDDEIKLYATEEPTKDLTVQIKVVR